MPKVKVTALVKGSYILEKGEPQAVVSTKFHHAGRGGGVSAIKMKNIVTGASYEKTYKSNEQVELIDVESTEMQFLYADGDDVVFMNPRTYEQVTVSGSLLEGKLGLLTPDARAYIISYDNEAIGVSLPPKVHLKVVVSPDAVAGNTVGAAKKEVELETGLKVLAPLFIKVGDVVSIDTETAQYVGRKND